jgi:uracil-DNA glycosylase
MNVGDLVMRMREFDAPNVFNPWRHVDPLDRSQQHAAMDRRTRLYQHFDCKPDYILIGEAPGYQGCHFSGVPFTNEKLIIDGAIPRVTAPTGMGPRITTRERPWCEPSATIVWRTLHKFEIAARTVMWNAFAWHPHKPGDLMSNRAPTREEVKAGAFALRAVLEHFDGAKVVAVGKVAAAAIERLNLGGPWEPALVRHPSMGGAAEFEAGMRRLFSGDSNGSS